MNIPIVFEDSAVIVLNKPPGIVVNRADSVKVPTVQDWLEEEHGWKYQGKIQLQDEFIPRTGIVHRIDKETSGILLVAKLPEAFCELQRQFKERIVHKTYLALTHGSITPPTGEISAPVARLPWNRERFGIVPEGKESITHYEVRQTISYQQKKNKETMTLVELSPQTGRTHQIRVHLKYINHPIMGDYLYAGRKTARDDRKWIPRVMLHAWKIEFFHPLSQQKLDFTAPIPDDMNRLINLVNNQISK